MIEGFQLGKGSNQFVPLIQIENLKFRFLRRNDTLDFLSICRAVLGPNRATSALNNSGSPDQALAAGPGMLSTPFFS